MIATTRRRHTPRRQEYLLVAALVSLIGSIAICAYAIGQALLS